MVTTGSYESTHLTVFMNMFKVDACSTRPAYLQAYLYELPANEMRTKRK